MSGMLYGVNMVPMMLWTQHQKNHGHTPGTFDFVFSHFTGIYLYSTAVFLIYCIVNRPPKMYPAAVLPSIISGTFYFTSIFIICLFYLFFAFIYLFLKGAMWGIAQCGLMSATTILGYAVGFPIGSAGPIIVSSTWSVVYFREIRGARNLLLLGASFALLFTGIILLALSK